jgi:hypothetical protein
VSTGDSFGARSRGDFSSVVGSLDVSLGSLDDYYDPPAGVEEHPARGRSSVPPRQRNSRGWATTDRFCEPTITGMRSTGSRRRPPAG